MVKKPIFWAGSSVCLRVYLEYKDKDDREEFTYINKQNSFSVGTGPILSGPTPFDGGQLPSLRLFPRATW
jgi:hypothetical protein